MERKANGQYVKRITSIIHDGFPVYYDSKGYQCIWFNGKGKRLHVYIWEKINGEKPNGFDIHHIDMNKENYALENLVLLSKQDHRRIHAGWIKNENGEWAYKPCNKCGNIIPLSYFYQRNGHKAPSALCKICHNKWQENKTEFQKQKHRVASKKYKQKRRMAVIEKAMG